MWAWHVGTWMLGLQPFGKMPVASGDAAARPRSHAGEWALCAPKLRARGWREDSSEEKTKTQTWLPGRLASKGGMLPESRRVGSDRKIPPDESLIQDTPSGNAGLEEEDVVAGTFSFCLPGRWTVAGAV